MPISQSDQIRGPVPVPCRPACCKTPSKVGITARSGSATAVSFTFTNFVYNLNGTTFTVEAVSGSLVGLAISGAVGRVGLVATFTPSFTLPAGGYVAHLIGVQDGRGCTLADVAFTFTV